jgi:hypothetical protein
LKDFLYKRSKIYDMNNMKGLSQILYLIIAASVLMIAALSLVFMLNDGLSGLVEFGGEADATACERQAAQLCSGTTGGTYDAPSACYTVDDAGEAQPTSGVSQDGFSLTDSGQTVECG